jgi:tetratricopeptide (TPR) repeat protein
MKTLILTFFIFSIHFFGIAQNDVKPNVQKGTLELVFENTLNMGLKYQQSNFKKADSLRQPLYDKAAKLGDSAELLALFYDIETDRFQGKMKPYKSKILVFENELLKKHGSDFKIFMLQALANGALDDRDFEKAEYHLRKAIAVGKSKSKKLFNSESFRLLSLVQMNKFKKDSALIMIDRAIALSRRIDNREQLAICFNTQGEIYKFFGQSELGVAKHLIALQIVVTDNNPRLISQFNNELGVLQLEIGNTLDALMYFSRSIENANQVKDYLTLAKAYLNSGKCYKDQGNLQEAKKNYKKSIELYQQEGDLLGLSFAHRVIGVAFRQAGDFYRAEENLIKALKYQENKQRFDLQTETYLELGRLKLTQKRSQEANSFLLLGLNRSMQYNQAYLQNLFYQTLAENYASQKNFDKAFYYLQRYTDFSDSSKNIVDKTKIAELSELYKVEQRERIIVEQGASIAKQQKEAELTRVHIENSTLRNNFIIYFVIGLLVISILVIYLVINRLKHTKLKQLQREAEMNQTLLRTQMNPHFIFNAMSVIQSYIYDNDVKNSTKFLVNFSRLMRLILENSPKEFIPIETEKEILEKYLQIQKLRFEDRFDFDIFVEDQLFEDGAVLPPMITQPFIENAIEHGQLHTVEGGFIHIYFRKDGDYLSIQIEDNGIGRKAADKNKKSAEHKSMAMKITDDRIQNLNEKYKSNGYLELEDFDKLKETGTLVRICLPYQHQQPTELNELYV